ncbi:MAG: DNA polymerase III subunit [Chloroflexi bacterium]|nr:DNA polymerase III subunit [Chloroflexota bacterium]
MSAEQAGGEARWGVRGLEQPVAELRAALAADRLGHAWLFSGPDGVGKGTLARRLVQALHCEQRDEGDGGGVDPCLECRACARIEGGEAPDVEWIAIGGPCDEEGHRDHQADGSTRIRICQARRLSKLANLAPFHAARRVFIIDSANDLQTEAAQSLLKTLEEPPGSALLILLAVDPDELLPTIRSRCRELTLRPLPRAALAGALAEDIEDLDAEDAGELAAQGRGRYGLALRLHRDPAQRQLRETAIADVRRLCGASRNERFDHAGRLAGSWRRERRAVLETLDVWRWWWRDTLAAIAEAERGGEEPAGGAVGGCSPREAVLALRATERARRHLIENTNPQLALEVLMLDLPRLQFEEPEPSREEARPAAAPPA